MVASTRSGIHYEVSAGSGPAVVFLHGVTLDSRLWRAQVDAFGSRWRCVTSDLRGHGRSAALEAGYDPAADLVEVIDAAGVGAFTLVGLSLGGHDAVVFAGLHPERCRSLMLVDAWLPGPEMAGWEPPYRLAQSDGAEAARRAWLADPLFATAGSNHAARAELAAMVGDNDLRIWTDSIPRAPHPDTRELALGIRVPTQVVVGDDELPQFRAVAEWLAANVPGAAGRPLVSLPGAGHLPPMEAAEQFNRELAALVEA